MRALLVEDDTASRLMLESVLRLQQHEVSAFAAAEPALAACRTTPFELALIDWELPGMSGLELCRELRSQAAGQGTCILILTGHDRDSELQQALAAGADDLMAKPIDPQALLARLQDRRRSAMPDRQVRRSRHDVVG